MSYFVSITAIFMAVFALRYLTKCKVEILFPLVNLSIILMLYVFGMCKIILIGGYIILSATLVLFVWTIIQILRRGEHHHFKQFFNSTTIVLLIFSVVQFFALSQMKVVSHDEMTHWGLVVKNMFYHHNFGGGATATTMFKGYPVGSSLYLYFFQMFGTEFAQQYLYMAMNLLNISLLLPVISKFEKAKDKFIAALIVIGTAFAFNYKMFASIWNDQFLSISFAFILISYFCFVSEKGLPKANFISMLLATFALISSKSTGLILVIFAYLIIGLDLIVNRRALIKQSSKRSITTCCLVVLAILVPKVSWSIYLKFIDVGGAWQTSQLTVKNVFKYCFAPNQFQAEVTRNFFIALVWPFSNKGNAGSLPIPVVLEFLIMGLLIFMIQNKKKSGKKGLALACSVFITFVAYIIGLLISYIFTFEAGEALALASFVRYVNTYALGAILFLISYYIIQFKEFGNKKMAYLLTGVIALGLLTTAGFAYSNIISVANDRINQFSHFSSCVQQLDKCDRVYIINNSHDSVKDYLQMRFIATPLDASGLKIGGSPHIGDMWDKGMTVDELSAAIIEGNYNYLYIHDLLGENLEQYQSMFATSIATKTMYKVINNNEILTFE